MIENNFSSDDSAIEIMRYADHARAQVRAIDDLMSSISSTDDLSYLKDEMRDVVSTLEKIGGYADNRIGEPARKEVANPASPAIHKTRFGLDRQYARREFVTPERAESLLGDLYAKQRKKRNAYVEAYAIDMRDDNWNPNVPATIAISVEGKLLDGQHRLTAIVESGIGQWMWVIYDVDEDVYEYIDSGHSRTIFDRDLDIANASCSTAFVRKIIIMDKGWGINYAMASSKTVTQQQILNYIRDNYDYVQDCANRARRIKIAVGNGVESCYAFTVHMAKVIYGDDAPGRIEDSVKEFSISSATLQKKVAALYKSVSKNMRFGQFAPTFIAYCDTILKGRDCKVIRNEDAIVERWDKEYKKVVNQLD